MESYRPNVIGYEFAAESDARAVAAEIDRRFDEKELTGLRVYRIVWNGNFLVEATFAGETPDSRVDSARAILGESGSPVHEDDLEDYRRATRNLASPDGGGLRNWFKGLFR